MKTLAGVIAGLCLLTSSAAMADTHYVDISNATPSAPYTNWATAATSIQSAVDAASSNDTVLVNDGTYHLTSEILVDKDITISSVNGPDVTIIDPEYNCRGFNLGESQCLIAGFTITDGNSTGQGGGISCFNWMQTVSNCTLTGNTAVKGGGMSRGVAYDCIFSNNAAINSGGGMSRGDAYNCIFYGNSTEGDGGGHFIGDVFDCTFYGNTANGTGGGKGLGDAYRCTFISNRAGNGGGMEGEAGWMPGGEARSCIFIGNSAIGEGGFGGGMFKGDAYNCTFVNNTARGGGGGMFSLFASDHYRAANCIVYYNHSTTGGDNLHNIWYYNTCSPDIPHGVNGCITNAPQFIGANNYRLAPNSPCINAGNNGYVPVYSHTDLDGNPRIWCDTVDMGAYEYQLGLLSSFSPVPSGFTLAWNHALGWNFIVQYSTNLVSMPFTDLSDSMAYPINSYTDTVHGAGAQCFYRVEMAP